MPARPRRRTLILVACAGVTVGLALAPADRPEPAGRADASPALVRVAEPGLGLDAPERAGRR